LVFVKFACT